MKICIAPLALLIVASAPAQKGADVPKEIKAIYDAQIVDFAKGNWKDFFSYYDPKFEDYGADGKKQTFADFKNGVDGMVQGTTRRIITISYTGAKSDGKTATVSYIATFEFGKPKGKPARFKEVGTDTWKKTPAGWKEVKTVDKSFGPIK